MFALLVLTSLSAQARAQKTPPQLLARAAHCLAVKNFLPSSPSESRSFGYLLDEKSYPHERVIYVVDYAGPDKSNGWVFAIVMTEHDGQQRFNVQNNATFVLSRREADGVSFVGDGQPLGGTWTQQHIAMAIKRIEIKPRFSLDDKYLSAAMPSTTCESYAEDARSHH